MTDTPTRKVLQRLYATIDAEPKPAGSGWSARCPAHDDRHESLSVAEGADGRTLLHCHAGCAVEAICAALNLTLRDLMPGDNGRPTRPKPKPARARQSWPTGREAVEALERQHGPRSAAWKYHNADGEPVGLVLRWDSDGRKDIRPVSRGADGRWFIGAMPEPRPLYGVESLGTANRVYVCEGEKCADAARGIGLVAVTSAGGSGAAAKSDWSPLAGHDVVLLPDNDDAGRKYADDVTSILPGLSPPATVRVVALPGLPPGCDVVDFIDAHQAVGESNRDIRARIERLADATPRATVPERVPRTEPFQPFPIDALPEPVAGFVRAGAKSIGCDPSMIALPLLAGLCSAIGATRRIRLKTDWVEPAVLWTGVVADSGAQKSSAQSLALGPLRRLQAYRLDEYPELLEAYQRNMLLYDADLREWKNKGRKRGEEPPEKPGEPPVARYITSDITTEALAEQLKLNPRGLLCDCDELGSWLLVARFGRPTFVR